MTCASCDDVLADLDYGCTDDGRYWGPCGHPNCYGRCEDLGDCECECHESASS